MTRVGLYGGSFDPVHCGHLILARDAVDELALNRLHLVPAAANPFKPGAAMTASEHRLAMLRLATADMERVVVDDREIRRGGISFAIDTVLSLRADHPNAEIFLLLGGDNAPLLDQWHRFGELKDLVRFAGFPRADADADGREDEPAAGIIRVGRRIDLSSTEVRERVAAGKPLQWLVPDAVRDYIARHRLYLDT